MLATRARQLERDPGDALDLRRAIDHRVNRLLDAVDAALFLWPAVVDAAGQLAHHHQIETAHDLGAQRRGFFQTREDAHGTQISVELVIPTQDEERVLGTLFQRLALVFGKPDAAKENRVAPIAELASLRGERRKPTRERGAADGFLDVLDVGTHATQDRDGSMRHLGADAVPG